MVAARGVLQPSVGLEWYEALCDDPADAKAQHAKHQVAVALGGNSLPRSDGAAVDPRFQGGAR
jgi:hypothetical protein